MSYALDQRQPIVLATCISLSLYLFLLFGIFFYLGHSQEIIQRFTSKKDDFLDVTLVQRKVAPVVVKEKQRIIKKEPEPQRIVKPAEPKKEIVKQAAKKETADLQDLFKSIDTSKLAKEAAPISVAKPKVQSRLKPTTKAIVETVPQEKAKNLTASLELETKPVSMLSQSQGVYDPYRGKISEILDAYWQETIDTVSGAEAKVTVTIDYQGSFSYTIVSMSYNDAFNAKLRDFLETMRDKDFPPYMGGEFLSMTIKFKDVLER